ncbi:hypothetical protein EIP91_011049 [Steccherinum ochraceum]|uniref:RNase III domain-containing protein n=1 Tax=Steccherinum ochraceum TaxID=92696 RepID=A0A4R0S1S0_9APHY|nr:hypothetical protein EIP91_011049 [Steccherinum ochraceum]
MQHSTTVGQRKRQHVDSTEPSHEGSPPRKRQKGKQEVEQQPEGNSVAHRNTSLHDDLLQDATTGRFIRSTDAPRVVQRLLSTVDESHPKIDTETDEDGFACKISFYSGGPFKGPVSGTMCSTRDLAMQSAYFQVCRRLFKRGLLDHTYFPRENSVTTSMASPPIESSVSAKAVHMFSKKSALFWANTLQYAMKRLYPTFITVQADGETHAPFILLTRRPIPALPIITVFESGRKVTVKMQPGAPWKPSQEQIHQLHGFTLRVFRTISNKGLGSSIDKLPYLVAPLVCSLTSAELKTHSWKLPSISGLIAWDLVDLAKQDWKTSLISEDGGLLAEGDDVAVQDRTVEFTNRFILRAVRYDMNPDSKTDEGKDETFLERCKARVKGFEGLKLASQPMLEVEPFPPFSNCLNPHFIPQPSMSRPRFLIPELCHKFVLPASLFRSMLLLPSIMHQVDQLLVAIELNDALFDNTHDVEQILSATSSLSTYGELNYERLEFLGDASLKMMSSTYCYLKMPRMKESAIHNARQKIISNRVLYDSGVQAGLPPFIQNKPFIVKIWQPEILVPGSEISQSLEGSEKGSQAQPKGRRSKQKESQLIQWLPEKTVADVVEALIAVGYLSSGNEGAFRTAKALHLPFPDVQAWSDLWAMVVPVATNATLPIESIQAVEKLIGMKIKRLDFLTQAFTHPSLYSDEIPCYEQLEFLGDAVLDFLVSRYVYNAYPKLAPGGMSLLKAAMVSNATLATVTVLTGLHKHLLHSSDTLTKAFATFETELLELQQRERRKGEAGTSGQYWLETSPSKALADVFESVLGAIYVSDGFCMDGVDALFDNVLKPFYQNHISLQSLSPHPSKTLYDLFHQLGYDLHSPIFQCAETYFLDQVVVHSVILASATDKSSSLVSRMAAAAALDALQGDLDFMTRTCDCRTAQASKKQPSRAQLGYEDGED